MNVLITTQVFPPEIHPTARVVMELARMLVEVGHNVTVATGFPHHPRGEVFGGYRKRLLLREELDGVRVLRGWHLTSTSDSIFLRSAVYVSQSLGTVLASLHGERPDVVINFGPPLAGPFLSLVASGFFRARQFSVIYDLYPDVAVEAGAVRNRLLIRMARTIEHLVYRRSDRIVVLSEGFRRTLVERKGVEERKVAVIPVWINTEEIHKVSAPGRWRDRHGIPRDAFVVLYAGTIGLISGAEVMCDVAMQFSDDPKVLFLFVGEGRQKDLIRERSAGRNNVRFLDFQPRNELSEMLSSADVGVMTLLPGRGRTSVPSKILGYMAAELPVVASCDPDSDSARMVNEAACGIVAAPSDPNSISDAIRTFQIDTAFRNKAGKRGRSYLEKHHSLEAGTSAFLSLLDPLGSNAVVEDRGCRAEAER
jgi:colanic acid biosynthesis glycosyl transferase WcaI